jgi:hypothetical protein
MGINLSRLDDGKEWTCNNSLWNFILDTALAYNWIPSGTYKIDPDTENEDSSWDKSDYRSNNGQLVTENDIENLINSLNQSLTKNSFDEIENNIIRDFIKFVKPEETIYSFEIY